MVNVVRMARTPRSDEALSAGAGPASLRRWLLVTGAVLLPIAVGALATLVLYATRARPAVAHPAVVASADVLGHDGSVLVLQPRTTEQIRVPLGTTVEIVLEPGIGQDIVSDTPGILADAVTPPCHVTALCGFPGAHIWTFRAVHPGVGYLKMIFAFTVCRSDRLCTIEPYAYKPISVPPTPGALS